MIAKIFLCVIVILLAIYILEEAFEQIEENTEGDKSYLI